MVCHVSIFDHSIGRSLPLDPVTSISVSSPPFPLFIILHYTILDYDLVYFTPSLSVFVKWVQLVVIGSPVDPVRDSYLPLYNTMKCVQLSCTVDSLVL